MTTHTAGLGTGAVAAGAAFYYLGVRDDRVASVAAVPTRGGAVLSWSGRW